MLEALRSLSVEWYRLLSELGGGIAEPVRGLADQLDVPAASAFLFGLIGSLAPCQLSANAGAMAYVSGRTRLDRRLLLSDAVAYALGKVELGYSRVMDLQGGMRAWQQAGGPLGRRPSPVRASRGQPAGPAGAIRHSFGAHEARASTAGRHRRPAPAGP